MRRPYHMGKFRLAVLTACAFTHAHDTIDHPGRQNNFRAARARCQGTVVLTSSEGSAKL